jgi:hypothetical protein
VWEYKPNGKIKIGMPTTEQLHKIWETEFEFFYRDIDGNLKPRPMETPKEESTELKAYWAKRWMIDTALVDKWKRYNEELYLDEKFVEGFKRGAENKEAYYQYKIKELEDRIAKLEIDQWINVDEQLKEVLVSFWDFVDFKYLTMGVGKDGKRPLTLEQLASEYLEELKNKK